MSPIIGILAAAFLEMMGSYPAPSRVQVAAPAGVVHVRNSETPAIGTIELEAEKVLTINPFDQPDVGFDSFSFSRRSDGAATFYADTEFHRFGPKGEYLGRLSREGQGPGEFGKWRGAVPFYLGDKIWVSSGQKLAEFGPDGKLLSERTLKIRPAWLVDESHFLAERVDRGKEGSADGKALVLVRFGKESLSDVPEVEILSGSGLGSIKNKTGRGGLVDSWGTPNMCFAYDSRTSRIYAAINTEYKILVKGLRGETLSVIERAHVNAKVDRKDIEWVVGSFVRTEQGKWMLDAYSDRYVAINSIWPLPNGYLLVRRVTGPKQTVIDVFGPDGNYLYALFPPEGLDFNAVVFHSAGFSRTVEVNDFRVYEDYRITNLPEIFGR